MKNDDEKLDELARMVVKRFDKVDQNIESIKRVTDLLDGDKLIDNQDLCLLFNVTKRTLQRYRQKGILPYGKMDMGKCLYLSSEIRAVLESKFKGLKKW